MFEFLSWYTCDFIWGVITFYFFLAVFSAKNESKFPLSPSLLVYKPFKGALLSIWVRILGISLFSMFIFIYFYKLMLTINAFCLNFYVIDIFVYFFIVVLIIHSIIGLHHALRLKSLTGMSAQILSEIGDPDRQKSKKNSSFSIFSLIIGFNNFLFISTSLVLLLFFYYYFFNLIC